ncbi:MAG: chemotaxis protein CheA [Undibacterium sp.]|nr:chemotaxis protein CheA [Undibacterium sp.]
MKIDMSQFFQVFFDEAEELLAEKERLLIGVDVSSPDPEDLNAIFRTAHSIKGGASTFGISDMSDVTHILENLLDKIRKGEMVLTAEHVDAFLAAKDVLKMQLDGHRFGAKVDLDVVGDVRMLLQSFIQDGSVIKPAALTFQAPEKNDDELFEFCFHVTFNEIQAEDLHLLSAELALLGEIECKKNSEGKDLVVLHTNGSQDDIVAICSFILDADKMTITKVDHEQASQLTSTSNDEELGYGFFEPIGEMLASHPNEQQHNKASQTDIATNQAKLNTKKESDKSGAAQESTTIRVGIEKVDQIINLIGELVITQAMLAQRTQDLDPVENEKMLSSIAHLTRNTRDLQEAVMSIRMMPMDYVFSRFPRMVRDLATKLGKKVEFITYGASTELDKGLIERIVDPLTHLVRNSIDHGIEMPAIRHQNGKTEVGKLSLSAVHQGGNVVIEVCDDGGGLDRVKILAKAKSNGLNVTDSLSDSEVWQLIFAPGFSTAEVVTDVSGRGVGMDVVKRNITQMGGVVDIRSAKGFGTTITISLPLTLAILDGMSIKVGDEIYILPLGFVVESLQPHPDDIRDVNGQGRVLKIRQEYLPLIPLFEFFNIVPQHTDPAAGILVIVEVDGKKAALFVDDLVGQQQVVVKNIESNYRKIPGISGATILGDGGVSLILDVAALLRLVR